MLGKFRRAGLFWPAIAAAIAFAVLLALGTWQLERKAWKEGLLAAIEAGLKEVPAPLEDPKAAWSVLGTLEYRPVTVKGRFLHDREQHVFATDGQSIGWHVFTPLETAGGNILLVNRGFVPDQLESPDRRSEGQIPGVTTVVGLVRHAEARKLFDAAPDLEHNRWYWRDIEGMAKAAGLARDDTFVLPFYVDASAEPANPGGWPKGGTTHLKLSNRHLEYALTWYGLAAALAAVFGVFAAQRLKGVG